MPFNPLRRLRGVKYTAIDFGHHSLKAVRCQAKKDDIKALDCGQVILPQGSIVNGRINDISHVSRQLNQLINSLEGNTGQVIFAPAVGQEFVRKISIPSMPEDELEEALRWEVEEYLNLPPEQVASDFLILEEGEEELEVLLVVLPLNILDGYKEVFNRLNINPRVANAQELSLISLLTLQNKLAEPAAIINIGAEKTRITIASQNEFFLSRTVEQGGNNFTKIFKEEDNSWEEAENNKIESEIPLQQEEEEALDIDLMISGMAGSQRASSKLREEAGRLAEEISRSLEYYQDRHSGERLTNVFVTGGGLRLTNLQQFLEQEVGYSLNKVKPFHNIRCENSSALEPGEENVINVALGLVASEVIYDAH